jgi:hypothetical protein
MSIRALALCAVVGICGCADRFRAGSLTPIPSRNLRRRFGMTMVVSGMGTKVALTRRGRAKRKPLRGNRIRPAGAGLAIAARAAAKGTSRKLAISLERSLAQAVEAAAMREADGNVSAWLADAARQRLRLLAAREALRRYEAKHGAITEAELAQVRREWPRD